MIRFCARAALAPAVLAALALARTCAAQESVLTFDRFTQVVTHRPPSQKSQVDTSSAQILVVLGEQRLVVREPEREFVYDFGRRRVRIVDATSMTYADWSLFGLVAFNDLELKNRLRGGAGGTPRGSVRELEALFSMPAGVQPNRNESLADSSRGNSVDVLINGHPFTHAVLSETTLPASQVPTFERFLLYHFHLHPAARRAIMRTGRVPRTLFWRTLDGNEETLVSWRLRNATTTPEVNDPTLGLPRKDITDDEFASLSKRLVQGRRMSADSSRARRTRQSQEYEAAAVKAGRFLDAALARLARDMEACKSVSLSTWPAELRERIARDTSFRACLDAADTMDAGHGRAILERLVRIDPDRIEMDPVVDLLVGRARLATGDFHSGVPQVIRGLKDNPCAINAWMDLGHAYFQTYQPVLAWLCFDAARAVAPEGCPLLQSSARLEADLLRRHPEFFE